MERSAGILLPVFSLPGAYGIGTLGREARAFIDFLHTAGQRWWQVLPVGPTGAGDSPYTSVSTFAGNPLFIDPEDLADRGLLTKEDLAAAKLPWAAAVDYGAVYARRETLLRRAFSRLSGAEAQKVRNFAVQRPWLREYALYRALKARFHEAAWTDWPDRALRDHEAAAVEAARRELAEEIAYHEAVQFWFFSQWEAMKQYANGLGVKIIGDLPIYVSLDSADVWSERKEFLLDGDGLPARVAGVPPDYFSEEGQLWGNPLYDWAAMKADGFGWWIRRVEGASHLYDAIRIDHFRAFESYWSVPAGAESAKEGRWEKGPGMDLLGVLTGWFPNITYIAEDLGLLTPEVHQLRERAGLPGMKVLEFAFSGPGQRLSAPPLHQPGVHLLRRHPRQRHRPGLVRPRGRGGAGLRGAVSGCLRPGERGPGAPAVRHGQHGGAVRGPDAGLPGPWQRGAHQRPRRGGGQLALADGPRRGCGRTGRRDPRTDRDLQPVLTLDGGAVPWYHGPVPGKLF